MKKKDIAKKMSPKFKMVGNRGMEKGGMPYKEVGSKPSFEGKYTQGAKK